MPYTDRIKKPVSIYDVQQAIGVSSNDLATLCMHSNIKMWARYRPVEYHPYGSNFVGVMTEAMRTSVNFGITNIPTWANKLIGRMMNYWFEISETQTNAPECGMMPRTDYWKRVLPTTAFRLSDFAANPSEYTNKGYFPGAKAPLGKLTSNAIMIGSNGEFTIIFEKNEAGVSEGLTVKLEDLTFPGMSFSYANYYFGVALYNVTTGNWYYITQQTKMGSFQEMGASVHIAVTSSSFAGTFRVFPFLSSQMQATLSSDANVYGYYCAIQDTEDMTLTIRYAKIQFVQIYVWYDLSQSTRLIYYYIKVTNTEPDVIRDYTLDITFYRSDGVTQIYTKSIPNLSIAAGATVHVEGSQDLSQYGGPTLVGAVRAITTVTTQQVVFKQTDSIVTNTIYDHEPIIPN